MSINIADCIQFTSDMTTPYTSWFFYGMTGSGKTTIASTFPSPLFLVPVVEKSHVTLLDSAQSFPVLQIGYDPTTKERVHTITHMHEVLTFLEDQHREMQRLFSLARKTNQTEERDELFARGEQMFPWETIVVESLTHYADMVVEDLSQRATKQMNQGLWGKLSSHLRTVHDRLRGLEAHIVYTALDKVVTGEGGGIAHGSAAIPGAMSEKLPSACDSIGYCEEGRGPKGEVRFFAHFRRHGVFPARSRFKRMPAKIENFNFADVQQYIGTDTNQ